ncbi:SDR family NAD(P)-dependent oxidoreductase [Alteribacillus bidgolensis]|uniref:Gluconate 5-dehydrogenase/2-deoxy-D-gluconate 3-dehydrogenase n=1 Tax=Alteribacillus bidgolensis TaxID=930129 RepID=A0A1G8QZ09_9BACI|nr:glucose 1-dehydrogenase [Alteribacillus bidgolensis]SDJ09863.1 gluconate 5-dehydrogenase/2-deoxy-D-gluconate 3-dehydrogenase [Alteribacillus bidgolensis]
MSLPIFNLTGKTALITGGSKGIGLGMAKALGKAGANIVIASRGEEDLQKAAEDIRSFGATVKQKQTDVTDKNNVNDLIDFTVREFGSLDILVNNAGRNIRKKLIDIEEDDWNNVLDTNLKGIFLTGQAAAHQMITQKSGKIINISSIFGRVGGSFQTSYAASKGGINQLTKVWADELSLEGINVNAIAPAYIKTPMTQGWLSDEKRFNEIVDKTMMKRVGELKDLEGPVVFLASEAASYVTGQILYVDGGWTAK